MDRDTVFTEKKALLLDMNGTFMFGEDRFGECEDFSRQYKKTGGTRDSNAINQIIRAVYKYLDVRYSDKTYQRNFPSVEQAIREVVDEELGEEEIERIVETFAFHELGYIPTGHRAALHGLWRTFELGAVIDIWSPNGAWLNTFEHAGISELFSAMSFSSDHGMIKPSPEPFERVLGELGLTKAEAVVVGDSPPRDLGGARNAGIDCILVGGATHPDALACFENLIQLCHAVQRGRT